MHSRSTNALNTYFNMMNANATARVYQAAVESGLLESLKQGPRTPQELAALHNFRQRSVELILDALVSLEVAERDDTHFQLSPAARFLTGHYENLGNEYWDYLSEFLQTGKPKFKMDNPEHSALHYSTQAGALRWMMEPAAFTAAELLHKSQPLQDQQRYLDVAAGSAIWSLAATALNPSATTTAVDWQSVLPVAQRTARELGLHSQLQTLPGDIFQQSLDDGTYDLAFVANFVHLLTEPQIEVLFRKLTASLSKNGRLVVVDVFAGQSPGDISRSMYQLGLEMRTERGRTYDVIELIALMEGAGLNAVRYQPLEAPPYTMGMLVGSR